MSYRRVEDVLDNGPADRTEELILVAIAENANDAGYGFPGVALIAHRARCGERHVLRLIKKIAVDGWLVTLPRAEGFGKKQTAFQLNLTKLASNVPHAAQIAHQKAERAQKKQFREDSHAAQIAHEKSGDISPQSQVTFEAISGDISPLPILKNHEPSLEPSPVADAPARALDFGENPAPAPPPKAGPVKSSSISEDEVESIRMAYPRKEAPEPARKAIRKQYALLVKGKVIKADGIRLPGMTGEQAVSYMFAQAAAYARSPTLPDHPRFIPHPATWFNSGAYTVDQAAGAATPRMRTLIEKIAEQRAAQ